MILHYLKEKTTFTLKKEDKKYKWKSTNNHNFFAGDYLVGELALLLLSKIVFFSTGKLANACDFYCWLYLNKHFTWDINIV